MLNQQSDLFFDLNAKNETHPFRDVSRSVAQCTNTRLHRAFVELLLRFEKISSIEIFEVCENLACFRSYMGKSLFLVGLCECKNPLDNSVLPPIS
jgi:hypothetical protein